MAVDTPARIAVLGAGPVGLEAALYARFLGYDVDLYERGRAAEHLWQWGQVTLFSPCSSNVSALGIAAIRAQQEDWQPPAAELLMTGRELAEQYYQRLAESDLLIDGLHEQTEVLAVGRETLIKTDVLPDEERGEEDFRILVRDASGADRVATADVVIDATGVHRTPNWLGLGGIPAVGEQSLRGKLWSGVPDMLGEQRSRFADRHVLVVGSGHSAATNLSLLAQLAAAGGGTRVTWVTRREPAATGPVALIVDDPLPARQELTRLANQLANEPPAWLRCCSATQVATVAETDTAAQYRVTLAGACAETIAVDEIINNTGYRPDWQLAAELQVDRCPATDAPLNMAQAIAAGQFDPASLLTRETNYYVLGAKSFGRGPGFLLAHGLRQVRDLFTIIGDRVNLDLYATVGKSLAT